jgi:hypothetical protein
VYELLPRLEERYNEGTEREREREREYDFFHFLLTGRGKFNQFPIFMASTAAED